MKSSPRSYRARVGNNPPPRIPRSREQGRGLEILPLGGRRERWEVAQKVAAAKQQVVNLMEEMHGTEELLRKTEHTRRLKRIGSTWKLRIQGFEREATPHTQLVSGKFWGTVAPSAGAEG